MRLINGKEYPDSLYGANLQSADLAGANLAGADLAGANLHGADLRAADLHGANLHGANFYRAKLQNANLRGANLFAANLHSAHLHRTNLQDANLNNTVGNSREIISLQTHQYAITYTATHMQIGCKRYSITEWMTFDDDAINAMDIGALDWWTHHKRWIQDAIEMNPARSTPAL
jgi:uncharacterized protein YjbI with pentapeptide repeats